MLQQFLEQNRESILTKWIDQTVSTYEPEMIRFLKKEKNQFSNPVRNTILVGTGKIYDSILHGQSTEECYQGLEEIIKIRAVQDFSPSKALSFLFDLKKIIREELPHDNSSEALANELIEFERNIDRLTGLAFDIYTKCRDKIHDIKIAEIRSHSQSIFEIQGRKKK